VGLKRLALPGAIAIAAALRFFYIGSIPPGLYHDEAFNGLDALRVLSGEERRVKVFFEANYGREPLFIYLTTIPLTLLGRSPGAIRVVAATIGTLTIPASYLMAKAMFDRRVGIITAAIASVTLWHVHLSRVGFRAVTMPLLVALAIWQIWLGLKGKGKKCLHLLAGGVLYGFSFYTYSAARFTPFPLSAFSLYLAIKEKWQAIGRGAIVFVLAAILTSAPLMLYALKNWEFFMGRFSQVSIFNPAINKGNLLGTLAQNISRTLLMFTHRGDFQPRHNVPHRPVFDPLMALFFVYGLIICVKYALKRAEHSFLLIWSGMMLMPTVLAEDAPHFLRASGILPVVFVLPAIGLDSVFRFLEEKKGQPFATCLVALALLISFGKTAFDYFGEHSTSEDLYYHFDTPAVKMAVQINRFLGIGWDGNGLRVEKATPLLGRRLYISDELWRFCSSVQFLVPSSPQLTVLEKEPPFGMASSGETMLIMPPSDYRAYLSLLPKNSLISAREGLMIRGDLDPEAYLLYITFTASPIPLSLIYEPAARFEGGIELMDYRIEFPSPDTLKLSLFWESKAPIESDYTVFAHLMSGNRLIAQSDSPPALGYYPTSLWRIGDVVLDEHLLSLPEPFDPNLHKLVVGLYKFETMRRLQVLDELGEPLSDSAILAKRF